ncbi:gfo/Idh/MocA family oxidoreductase [Lutibacter sp. HS1-25]|uniref:Gfo/Idh/MocA family protein n=1 Tax=Lutibacter sp. HS1-25 TaxID=2485000 RepID=UPI0010131A90|nr:Gfo/Idh/MocA family oxidoreductase [Lutibacter sp. HS1-25]RXP44574.1 gfo/Idh/MocA family oxidoreductase [Lutibacter sp. HS1-25]
MQKEGKKSKVIRWGIIGCGDVTEVKSGPPYYTIDGFELSAVMRRDEAKAKDFADRHDVKKYYTNADDLINDNEVDAIYIATPPDSHKYYGLKVALAGKPSCIEKPLAPNYKDSLEIFKAFETAKTPLFVAYYRRSLPRFDQVKKWIDEGLIGEVRHINWHLSKPASEQDLSKTYNWRTDKNVAVGGYFDDLASHGMDLFIYYLGNITEVNGISLNQQGLYTAKDAITACWIHENGVTGTGCWNFGCSLSEDKVTIYGSLGTIEFAVFNEKPVVLNSVSVKESLTIEHPKNVQYFHIEKMKDFLFEGKSHPSTGKTALHTGWVLDKILGIS